MSLSLQDYWVDDFVPLKDAGKVITRSLRDDEADPSADLFRKITSGAHVYTRGIPRVRHIRSSSLPRKVVESRQKVRMSSIMGILEEGGLAYCAVDSTLFLWKVDADLNDNNLMHYIAPSLVLSVGLVRPKLGVFKSYVEWCLVVNTQDQVILIAVAKQGGALQLVTTYYAMSNDGVRMLAVSGTNSGRIFLGGEDSSVYEMKYDGLVKRELTVHDQLELFYDADEAVPAVLQESLKLGLFSRKRTSAMAGFDPSSRSFKCQKVASSSASSLARNFVPDGLLKAASSLVPAVFKSQQRGPIQQIVVDDERKTLYSLSRKGWICSYDISKELIPKGIMECAKVARSYLEDASHARYSPRNTSNGYVAFPGGSSSAQAGLGGASEAQALKRYVDQRSDETFLCPASIHLVAPSESSTVTLVATTIGGLRLYITALPVQHSSLSELRPSSRLTLCYMRALPPTGTKWQELASASILESVHAHPDHKKRVSASLYDDGVFVAAIENDNGSSIVATCPDLARRQMEDLEGRNGQKRKAPGGVTESASEPLATPIVGGRVICIAKLPASGSSKHTLSLTVHSETPSDGYITGDIPSAFVPPPRHGVASRALVASNGKNGSITTLSVAVAAVVQTLGGNTVPLKHFQRLESGSFSRGPSYRISMRESSRGFSKSALDYSTFRGRTGAVTSNPASARLNRRLLAPAAAPLTDVALSHVSAEVDFVIMNNAGVHFFVKRTLLGELSSILGASGDNVDDDPQIDRFFDEYGPAEACAMCLGLAVSEEYNDLLTARAIMAAFRHGYTPRLAPMQAGSHVTGTLTADDPLVPDQYCFTPSPLYQGLLKLSCRLLRPVLHKPCVVVTEGRVIQSALSAGRTVSPAKVELLVDEDQIDTILGPLNQLHALIREHFRPAVQNVPGALRQSSSMPMDIDDDENAFVPALQNRVGLRNGVNSSQLSPNDARNRAHLIEEKNIHLLYRYLSRAIQVLNLFRILQRFDATPDALPVDWGQLHGLTVANLVQEVEAQDRVESLLNLLVTFGTDARGTTSVDLDGLSQELATRCHFYFSPGSRKAYVGMRKAEEAYRRGHNAAVVRSQLIDEAASDFKDAARFWHSPTLISGLILKSRSEETIAQIAARARANGSPLARAADSLMRLGDVIGVVDVCLITASNFVPQQTVGYDLDIGWPGDLDGQSLAWERDLYHRRTTIASANALSSPSVASSATRGTSVTVQDAARTCYAIILDHLANGAASKNPLLDDMVARCAESVDKEFLATFFKFLLDQNFEDILLRINARQVELWLSSHSDPELLARYYRRQDRFVEAAGVFDELARAEPDALRKITATEQNLLSKRIHLLTQARNAYKDAAEQDATLRGKFGDVSAGLETALLQQRVLHALQGSSEPSEEELTALSSTLILPSDLLNDYCARYRLYDFCLLLLNIGGFREMEIVQRFWKLFIETVIFPCRTVNQDVHDKIRELFNDGEEGFVFLGHSDVAIPLFDTGEWSRELERKVVGLGRELQNREGNSNGNSSIPVDYLLEILDFLANLCPSTPDVWPLKVLVDVGVPYWSVLLSYEDCLVQTRGDTPAERLRHIGAILGLMRLWTQSPASSVGRQQLMEAVQSSRFFGKLSHTRSMLEQLSDEIVASHGNSQLLVRLTSLQSLAQELSDGDLSAGM